MKSKWIKALKISVLIGLASSMIGCSSIDAHAVGYGKPFSGTALSISRQHCFLDWSIESILFYPFSLIDIPLSLATDVVFFPVDAVMIATPTTSYSNVLGLGCPRSTGM